MFSGHLRPIASSHGAPQSRFSSQASRPLRSYIAVACSHCRLIKSRCDGFRPSCTRCDGLELSCQYDVTQGVSRAERFKLQKKRQKSVANNLNSLVDALRSGTDLEATTVLARLRLGESVERVIQVLATNGSSMLENVQPCDAESEAASNMDSAADTWGLEPIVKYAATLPTSSVHLDVSNAGEVPMPTTADPFLCVIFEREDFRPPAKLEEDNDIVRPPVLSRTQHGSCMKQIFNVDETDHPFYLRIYTPYSTINSRAAPLGGEDVRHLRGSWALYPEVHDSLTTSSCFKIDQAVGSRYKLSGASIRKLPVPTWAMLCMNTTSGSDSMNSAFLHVRERTTALIQEGTPEEDICGDNPNIAALYDKEEHRNSCILSQWAASMVHSVKLKGHDFTCFASMYVFWYLTRWMIFPTRETYEAIPKWLRPTPNQLLIPHIPMLDFIIWPKLREFAVSTPPMQEKMDWLMDLSTHIKCQWPFALEEAIYKHQETGHDVLTDRAQEHMATLSNWSLGPSFRAYMPNADLYVSIRSENGR